MDVKDLRPNVFAADPESSDSKRQLSHCSNLLRLISIELKGLTMQTN